MKEFKDLEFKDLPNYRGIQCRIQFENGFGASVIRHEHTYGGKDGLYELAVLDTEGEITYDTSVTDDVVGYLTEDGVTTLLAEIQNL